MALTKSQKRLKSWTKQKWKTKSEKPFTQGTNATGEHFLPANAIKAMGAETYSSPTAKDKQVSKHPKKSGSSV